MNVGWASQPTFITMSFRTCFGAQIKHISLMLQNLNKLPRFFKVSAQISRKHEYDTKMIERNC